MTPLTTFFTLFPLPFGSIVGPDTILSLNFLAWLIVKTGDVWRTFLYVTLTFLAAFIAKSWLSATTIATGCPWNFMFSLANISSSSVSSCIPGKVNEFTPGISLTVYTAKTPSSVWKYGNFIGTYTIVFFIYNLHNIMEMGQYVSLPMHVQHQFRLRLHYGL